MADNHKSKVILIDGKNTGWYEKAIFILNAKGMSKKITNNMVEEAEKIVQDYINKTYGSEDKGYKEKNKYVYVDNKTNKVLALCMILSIILLVYSIIQLI